MSKPNHKDINKNLSELVQQTSSLVREENGFLFRDLNKNGKLDIYEDPRQPVEARVDDLLQQMTLKEKAGTLFIDGTIVNDDSSIEPGPDTPVLEMVVSKQMTEHKMHHFNIWQIPGARVLAVWHNNIQLFVEQTRLGIPVTIASDPRNHFSRNIFAIIAREFSQWCETLGFAAIGDPDLVRQFAGIVIYLDRPAVIPEINCSAKALLADFGASDAAILDVIFGRSKPEGRLPFELPSSMEAVRNQKEDLPYDSGDPLYAFGFGLSY